MTIIAPVFPRRILLAVTGLTPQIVTETLYALAVAQDEPWVPTEIRLITTVENAERARSSLLDATEGQFHAFCRDYGLAGQITFTPDNIFLIRDAAGSPLSDIRTPEDNTLAADTLLAEVRRLCADDSTQLHVSIAGGRKTMGSFSVMRCRCSGGRRIDSRMCWSTSPSNRCGISTFPRPRRAFFRRRKARRSILPMQG